MLIPRPAHARGCFRHGWLETCHTFSFADYVDPREMGWGVLRVLNDDIIAPGQGFPIHPHRDMEILTYLLSGQLRHQDSLGHESVVGPEALQRMSAGRGIRHSEFNASEEEPLHLLQIWIEPETPGLPPEYEQRPIPREERQGRWRLLASPDGAEGSVRLHQQARLYAALLVEGESAMHHFAPDRLGYLHVARGRARLGNLDLGPGDGVKIAREPRIEATGWGNSPDLAELILFDLPTASV